MAMLGGEWALGQYLADLPNSDELHLSSSADRADYDTLTELPELRIKEWLADVGHRSPDMDEKARAAYLIGYIAWAFGLNMGALHVAGRGIPAIAASAMAVRRQWYRWEHGDESGTALRFEARIVAAQDTLYVPLDNSGVGALIIAVHTPLIESLATLTKLGRSALWRLVADAVAAGWLAVGKQTGREAEAMQCAQDILSLTGAPLFNKQTSYVEIAVNDDNAPEQVLAREWFRARGGCCRYYTTKESAGSYCTTCVLNPPEIRDQRLQDHLKSKLLASA